MRWIAALLVLCVCFGAVAVAAAWAGATDASGAAGLLAVGFGTAAAIVAIYRE